jgi:hypothetical protein
VNINKEKNMTQETQEFQKVDTTVIQVRSVLNFMYALGYRLDETSKTGRFVTNHREHQGNRYLSMGVAIRMHNLQQHQWEVYQNEDLTLSMTLPKGVSLQQGFSPIGVNLAIASKLVQKVKFSVTRKGNVVTQDVMVKPLNATVLALIEPEA